VARHYGIDVIWRPVPSDEEVARTVADRVTVMLEAKLRKLDRLIHERMQRMMPLARKLSEDPDELAVVAMLLDESYQTSLHGIPEAPIGTPPPRPEPRRRSDGPPRRRGAEGRRRRR